MKQTRTTKELFSIGGGGNKTLLENQATKLENQIGLQKVQTKSQSKKASQVITQSKETTHTQPSLFRPLIATSLALALSASVAVAEPTLKQNGSTAITIENLKWENGGTTHWRPKLGSTSNGETSLEHLWFSWKDSSDTIASATLDGYSGNLARIKIGTSKNAVTLATDDKGIQMGASGTGTFIVDFGPNADRNLTLDLQSVSTGEPAFLGNIDIFSDGQNNALNISLPESGGKMKGNIAFKSGSGNKAATVNFKSSNATVEGRIGQVTGKNSVGQVVFEQDGTIDGTHATKGQAVYLSRDIVTDPSGGTSLTEGDSALGITFKNAGTIKGEIYGYGIIQDGFIFNAKITIDFQKQGDIIGNVISVGAFNTINFKEQGTITGSVIAKSEGRSAPEESGNVINFYKGGTISNSSGNALESTAVSNTINFYATKTGDTALNEKADATITGKIYASGSEYSASGTNIINFKDASEATDINEEIKNSGANSIKAVLGDFETSRRNKKTGINQIISTATNLDLTTGNIKGNNGGTTTIDVQGERNTLTLGELTTSSLDEYGSTEIKLFLKGSAQNTATIAKIRNGGTNWWQHNFETTIEATGSNNTVTIGEVTNIYATTDKGITISLLGTDTNKLTIGKEVSDNSSPAPTGNLTTQDNGGKTSIALGGNTATLDIQGKIDATSGKTAISFYKNDGTQNHTLTTKDILSKNNNSQVIINFGETAPVGDAQSRLSTPEGFITMVADSSMNSPALLNTTATNKAILGNIDTQSSNGGVTISLKGSKNTLTTQHITTAHGQKGVDITSTGATNEITTGKITTFGGQAHVNITLAGDSSAKNTAIIGGADSEKQTNITLGNATDTTAINTLKLGASETKDNGAVNLKFGKGTNTLTTSDGSGTLIFTNSTGGTHNIGFANGVNDEAKLTITNDILSQGKATNNGTIFKISGASQTIELANNDVLKTLTTTGSSQIHFLGESGSFRGNLTTQKGSDSDNPNGGNTKIILDENISTANLYTTANTTAGKMTFELNGNASASQTLALGGSLTTQEGAMTDFNFKQAGVYHLTQAEGASEARIVTGGVTNFHFANGESTLSFGTLQDGVSPASNPIAFEDNNHTGHFTFNLKGSDLTLLGSASDGVNRIFNVSNTTPADQSVLTSALRETIKVTNGATTTFNLLGEGDTLTLYKGVNVENGSSVVSFKANNQTLNLFGADSLASGVATQENTLYIFSTLSATNTASTQNAQNTQNTQNPTINLVNSDMPQKDRTNFNLLMIGVDPSSGANLVGADKGYLVENATFRIFVNEAQALHSSGSATLGGQKIDNSQDQASNSLGHAYSDRIIIGSIGDNTAPKQATLYLFPRLENLSGFKYTHLAGNKTGTETKGNVALATIANNDKGEALVTLEAKNVFVGVEAIQVNLETAITDIGGKIILNSQDKEQLGQTYTTYFLGSVESRGASETMQEISATALSLNYDLFLANFNSLNKRMGELRNHPNDNGIWARVFGGMLTSNYKVKNDIEYITTQAGYDYGFDLDGEARNYLGLAISYATSKSSVGSLLQGTAVQNVSNSNVALSLDNVFSQGVEVALYNSYVSNVGWYSDTIFKFSYIMSEFNLKNNNFISPKAQTNNFGFVLSEEVGYRFKLGKKKEWFIDPQVELAFGYLSDNTYQTQAQAGDGLVAFTGIADAILNLRTRAGSAFGYEMQSQQTSASIYVGAFYEFDYVEGGDASTILRDSLTTPHMNVLSSSGRAVLNVGSNISLQDHTRLYFDVEKSFGDKLRTHLQFNAGVRYSFGNKNPKHNKGDLSKELSSAPLKIQ